MEAIILAGGLGTRLRGVVADLPKPMAPIAGRPFLAVLLDQLIEAGFSHAVLAVGYRHAAILDHFGASYRSLTLDYSIEGRPLGTGGAIRLALAKTDDAEVFVVNGDTFLQLDYEAMAAARTAANAALSIAVVEVDDAGRYGALQIEQRRIIGFLEKGALGPGLINGGVYLVQRDLLNRFSLPATFSFETDLLMSHLKELRPLAFMAEGMFIDIGIPEDYLLAEQLLRRATEER